MSRKSSSLLILMENRNETDFKLLIAASLGDLQGEFGHCQLGTVAEEDFHRLYFKCLTQVVMSFYWPERVI